MAQAGIDLGRARRLMSDRKIDAVVAYTPSNFFYVTGYQTYLDLPAAAMALLPTDERIEPLLIVSNWMEGAARSQSWIKDIRTFPLWLEIFDEEHLHGTPKPRVEKPLQYDTAANVAMLGEALRERGLRKPTVGIELGAVSVAVFEFFKTHMPDVRWVDAGELFHEMRLIKSPDEIALLREATVFAEEGIKALAGSKLVGLSVSGLRLLYEQRCVEMALHNPEVGLQNVRTTCSIGGEFSPKVGGGARAKPGDMVFFDCGVCLRGYFSDTGRSLFLGKPTPLHLRVIAALRAGVEAAMALIKPGVPMCEVFHAGQETIRHNGLDGYTRGHIGHAVGVGMGEMPPFFSPGEKRPLEPGMVLTIETPLYVRGVGGFQIEECFVVTSDGYDLFNVLPRDLIEVRG